MTTKVRALLEEASALSEAERAELAAELLASLDDGAEEGVEEAWAAEIERRVEELRGGKVTPVPWEQVRREALLALNAARRR